MVTKAFDFGGKRPKCDGIYEIYFSADLTTVSERDVKGLYAKAKRGEIDDDLPILHGRGSGPASEFPFF